VFGLKLLGIHAIMSLVQFLLMPAFFGIFQGNEIYQWFVGLLFIAIFWLIIYADASSTGSEHSKKGIYAHYKGFLAGATASLPAIVVYLAGLIYGHPSDTINWFITILRIWLVPYTKVFSSLEHMILLLIPAVILIFPLISGFSYMDGPRKRKKVLDIIARVNSTKAEKSKVIKKRTV